MYSAVTVRNIKATFCILNLISVYQCKVGGRWGRGDAKRSILLITIRLGNILYSHHLTLQHDLNISVNMNNNCNCTVINLKIVQTSLIYIKRHITIC